MAPLNPNRVFCSAATTFQRRSPSTPLILAITILLIHGYGLCAGIYGDLDSRPNINHQEFNDDAKARGKAFYSSGDFTVPITHFSENINLALTKHGLYANLHVFHGGGFAAANLDCSLQTRIDSRIVGMKPTIYALVSLDAASQGLMKNNTRDVLWSEWFQSWPEMQRTPDVWVPRSVGWLGCTQTPIDAKFLITSVVRVTRPPTIWPEWVGRWLLGWPESMTEEMHMGVNGPASGERLWASLLGVSIVKWSSLFLGFAKLWGQYWASGFWTHEIWKLWIWRPSFSNWVPSLFRHQRLADVGQYRVVLLTTKYPCPSLKGKEKI